jgi:hypothetical protein
LYHTKKDIQLAHWKKVNTMQEEKYTVHLLTDQTESRSTGMKEEKTIYILAAVYALLLFGLFILPRIAARGMDGLGAAGTAGGTAILVGAAMTLESLVCLGLTMCWWIKLSPRVRAIGILPMVITTVLMIVVAILVRNSPTSSSYDTTDESTKTPYSD